MPTHRVLIDAALVERAVAEARSGVDGTTDYADTQLPGLVLRVRGHAVSWLAKNRSSTRKLGSPPAMGIRDARRKAAEILPGLAPAAEPSESPTSESPAAPTGWTWAELRDRYIAYVAGDRMKRNRAVEGSRDTERDVTFLFSRECFNRWSERQIRDITADEAVEALRVIQRENSHRQMKKALSYLKAALTWGYSNAPAASGLSGATLWWTVVRAPSAPPEYVAKRLEQQRNGQRHLTVDELGDVLARHEAFCRNRTGSSRVSPSVRWGFWWVAITAGRRGAAIDIERSAVDWDDPKGEPGWGIVRWPAASMKADIDFWLPIPPLGIHVMRRCMAEWRERVVKIHPGNQTKWVFASSRRIGRDPDNTDVALTPDALATHISSMRGRRKRTRDILHDVPHFSLHDIRGVAVSYLGDNYELPPGAGSALLSHQLHVDSEKLREFERMSRTTRSYYDHAQRMTLKTKAMEAWSEALITAYKKAGGIYPP